MKLPTAIKTKWLEALRSGEYEQGRGILHDGSGYCCLGILEMCYIGKVETNEYETESMPTPWFWKQIEAVGWDDKVLPNPNDAVLGMITVPDMLARMNDGENHQDYDFVEIADWIDENIEAY